MTVPFPSGRQWPLSHRLPVRDALPTAGETWILDLSAVPRLGIRGPGTAEWLSRHGKPLTAQTDAVQRMGPLALVPLGAEEVVILPDPADPTPLLSLRDVWRQSAGPKGFDAYRDETWAWFRLTGPAAETALPLLTALDTRSTAFPLGAVAQTRAMHMDAVILRSLAGDVDLLFDVASSGYALDFIRDVIPNIRAGRLAG